MNVREYIGRQSSITFIDLSRFILRIWRVWLSWCWAMNRGIGLIGFNCRRGWSNRNRIKCKIIIKIILLLTIRRVDYLVSYNIVRPAIVNLKSTINTNPTTPTRNTLSPLPATPNPSVTPINTSTSPQPLPPSSSLQQATCTHHLPFQLTNPMQIPLILLPLRSTEATSRQRGL